jgi:hypothetical protein
MAHAVDATRVAKGVAHEVEAGAVPPRAHIDAEIRTLKIAALENQFADCVFEFAALASKMRVVLLEIRALPIALVDIGRAAFDRGDQVYAVAAYATAERRRGNLLAEIEPTEVEIRAAAAQLADKIGSTGEPRLDTSIAASRQPSRKYFRSTEK